MNTTTIDFNGIQLSIVLTPFALQKYGEEMARLINAYPNNPEYLPPCSTATLAYWGRYEHCLVNDLPMIYSIDDFIIWAGKKLKTEAGALQVAELHLLYTKLAEG